MRKRVTLQLKNSKRVYEANESNGVLTIHRITFNTFSESRTRIGETKTMENAIVIMKSDAGEPVKDVTIKDV